MATRKCGNIHFPKYFMAVRPFFVVVVVFTLKKPFRSLLSTF